MKIVVRQETSLDHEMVFDLIKEAFQPMELSDHREQFLVNRLRKSKSFIPELSIVAEVANRIVGHILLTGIMIRNSLNVFDSLALAPISVLPEYQRQGIGGMLIRHAHNKAKTMGYKSIVVVGHEKYYPKFGYEKASEYGIQLPFAVPDENCMIFELVEDGLNGVSGVVEYPDEFNV